MLAGLIKDTGDPFKTPLIKGLMMTVNTLARTVSALAIVAVLAGCSTLPRDGPTGRAVVGGASSSTASGNYALVNLDYGVSERIKLAPAPMLASLANSGATSLARGIGPGDVLSVSIFEPTAALFGSGNSGDQVRSGSETLPALLVDETGRVNIPFAGSVAVNGLTAGEAATAIRRALAGKVANPQVLVSIASNVFNTVTVLGDIRSPGRSPLSPERDRIVDVIAAQGGPSRNPDDVTVKILRGSSTVSAPLNLVLSSHQENIQLQRGDQISLVYQPRRYSIFGAVGDVTEVDMPAGDVSLAGALSKAGGLDTNSANARSIFVFRFERPSTAAALGLTQPPTPRGVPVVYQLDLEDPAGFFTANNFIVQPDDIVFVPRSSSAEVSKFFTLVQSFTRVIYDVSVTSTLSTN